MYTVAKKKKAVEIQNERLGLHHRFRQFGMYVQLSCHRGGRAVHTHPSDYSGFLSATTVLIHAWYCTASNQGVVIYDSMLLIL